MNEQSYTGYALDISGDLIHIKDAKRGYGHNYRCPVCKKELGAKKGEVKEHHFAHKPGETHEGESVLHFLAKKRVAELISTNRFNFFYKTRLTVFKDGECELNADFLDVRTLENCTDNPKLIIPEKLKLHSPEIEKYINSHLLPDVICRTENNEKFAIEVFVTNQKDEDHILRYSEEGIPCIEINLSHLPYHAEIEDIDRAINDTKNHDWLYFSESLEVIDRAKKEFVSSGQVVEFLAKVKEKQKKKEEEFNQFIKEVDEKIAATVDDKRKQIDEFLEKRNKEKSKALNEQKPKKEWRSQKPVYLKNKPIKEKSIKVRFVQTHGSYRSGQETILKESQAKDLMKQFIVKPI